MTVDAAGDGRIGRIFQQPREYRPRSRRTGRFPGSPPCGPTTALPAEAVARALKVGLCEMHDFASATSSASTKLIHGGLRYLEHYEFRLVREALQEREVLLAKAPHLSFPLRFVLPHEPHLRPRWMLRLGLFL